jgi:hypothetical protein
VADKRAENRRKKPGPPNQQRSWFLPVVVLIVTVGLAGVALLAMTREPSDPADALPRVGDHWHLAYGVYDCDGYVPPSTQQTDPLGIHSHADGLIHVHPYRAQAAGSRAQMGLFIDAIGARLSDDRYVPGPGEPEGRELSEAEGCNGEPAELVLAFWPDATQDTEPEIIRENLSSFRFDTDSAAVAIALLPEGTTNIPRPPFLTQLQDPGDL